ncbi:GWxTD domain-containing protein [bacterium]|nr:GWxTD domain-containing protein [bacterium]
MIISLSPSDKSLHRCFFFCISLFFLFLLFFSFSSCRMYILEQKLDPENKEFLSKVRYIITQKEKKIFLELPEEERDEFKEEFWERRDPDPTTEVNEFRMKYFNRIERANELFISEGKPGWLTDRGRIYILFGPPTNRIAEPMGRSPSHQCQEVWYYGNFPVVFVDKTCTGDYDLVTYNLSSLRSLNLRYMHELNLAQSSAQKTIRKGETPLFDFNWKIEKTEVKKEKVEGIIQIGVPYQNIWFQEKNGSLVTTLDLHLELKDKNEEIIWDYNQSYKVKVSEENLKQMKGEKYLIEVPFILEKGVEKLSPGSYQFYVILKNMTGGNVQEKVTIFKIK